MLFNLRVDPNRIHWYDGQVLSCHDFHQNDNLLHYKIGYLASIIAPYSYGVLRLELDQAAISSNIIRLAQFECIMPDYTHIIVPMYNQTPVEIDLSSYRNRDGEQRIYCSLAEEHSLVATDFGMARYQLVSSMPVLDHSNNSNPKILSKLLPNLHLTTQVPNGSYLPLFKFSFSNGILKLMEYDYPSPDLRNCSNTFTKLKKVLTVLQEQLEVAISKMRLKNNTDDFKTYGHVILQELCPLFILLNSQYPNPFQIYVSLGRLVGTLSRIITDQNPRLDLYYDHLDIYSSYLQLIRFIEHKVEKIKSLHSLDLFKFECESENKYKTLIKNFDSPYLYILLQFNEAVDYEKWIRTAIIASQTVVQSVVIQKTTGCIRKIIESNRIDSLINVKVEIKFDTNNIKDNMLYIANYINKAEMPENIYLLLG